VLNDVWQMMIVEMARTEVQKWDVRQSSVACDGAQRDVMAQILRG